MQPKVHLMFYTLRDETGAGINYTRVGKGYFTKPSAEAMALKLSAAGGQPLRVVSTHQYREILNSNLNRFMGW